MHVKAILDDELLNWIEIKKWEVYEVSDDLWDYLLRAYWNRREKVEEETEEKTEEEEIRVEKKSKKSK